MVNRKLTGEYYHQYINPDRTIDAGAQAVHGITNESLKDKPRFMNIASEFMKFVNGAELIIHNAPFDIGFLNYELSLTSQWKMITEYCGVLDTLQLARKMHSGQRNSLDALCKRYGVDNSKRDLHGALIDTDLLAQVYLAMTGGQGSFFDGMTDNQAANAKSEKSSINIPVQKHNLTVLHATTDELSEHGKYLELLKKQGKCKWEEQ
jgi:DNA polymerase-3 subunit epsilon